MSTESVQFSELVRLAQALEIVEANASFHTLCPRCNDERPYIFVDEWRVRGARQERYQCGICGHERVYTVS